MDLLSAIRAAKELGEIAHDLASPELQAPWLTDERAFEKHFGFTCDQLMAILNYLSPEQLALYDRTLMVNPEAAVLWIAAMEELGP